MELDGCYPLVVTVDQDHLAKHAVVPANADPLPYWPTVPKFVFIVKKHIRSRDGESVLIGKIVDKVQIVIMQPDLLKEHNAVLGVIVQVVGGVEQVLKIIPVPSKSLNIKREQSECLS